MADKNDGGDKTEKPTPKKLQDARRKGNVAKSKDVTSTVELVVWLALVALALPFAGRELGALAQAAMDAVGQPFALALPALGWAALRVLLVLSALALLPVAASGLLTEFLQAGPVFATEKWKPKMEHLNPVEGFKRMFSLDNLVELAKNLAKVALLVGIAWLLLRAVMPQLPALMGGRPGHVAQSLWQTTRSMLLWTAVLFVLVSVLDAVWQRHSFLKKMRMSRRDIRQETKDAEGDPYVKQHRQQAHHEWSQQGAAQAASQAHALIVNPTHVAIALDYDRERCPLPTVRAKGEETVARAMREAAEAAGVPIVRNVDLARRLLADVPEGEPVPAELFDVIAEVVLWAREVREDLERARRGEPARPRRARVPGEDATRYPSPRPPQPPAADTTPEAPR